jgi:RHS repeat-associated protein
LCSPNRNCRPWSFLEERNGSDVLLRRYGYGQGPDDPLVMTQGTNLYYYHSDAQGSVTSLTNAAGDVQERYDYDAYGQPSIMDANWDAQSSPVGNPYMFTGQRYDSESSLYNYRNRYLEPKVGRFLTRDPLGAWGDPMNLGNDYSYVGNNPASYVDPLGLQGESRRQNELVMQLAMSSFGGPAGAAGLMADSQFASEFQRAFAAGQVARAGGGQALQDMRALSRRHKCYGLEGLHMFLDGLGMIEGYGIIFDWGNAALYAFEGRFGLAAASFASGIPLVGTVRAIVKYGDRAIDWVKTLLKFGKAVEEIADEGGDVGFLVLKGLCLKEGTLVHTKEGPEPIEEVDVGDILATRDESTGEIGWQPVTRRIRTENVEVFNIVVEDSIGSKETIGATHEHPFWVVEKGWLSAADLKPGDDLLSLNGSALDVQSVTIDPKRHTTYNFTVDVTHTYFVGEHGVWVHNNVCAQPTGQMHHAVSRKVYRALEKHPKLRGLYDFRDNDFVTQAKDTASHIGYQTWHRELDSEVAEWIMKNQKATVRSFERYLRNLYTRSDLMERFPNGL